MLGIYEPERNAHTPELYLDIRHNIVNRLQNFHAAMKSNQTLHTDIAVELTTATPLQTPTVACEH